MKRITIKWIVDEYEEMTNHVLVGIVTVYDMSHNEFLGEWTVKVGPGSIHYTVHGLPAPDLPLPEKIFDDHIDKMVRMYHNGYYKTDVCGWVK
jgi:hypothetical protein